MGSDGLALARRQLLDLASLSDGAVELVDDRSTTTKPPSFVISLDTSGLKKGSDGIRVRSREQFEIIVGSKFPFAPPTVRSVHSRWSGTPHVQWGRQLCLYVAPNVEWNPADGLQGFLERLTQWLESAAAGTLDPDGQPLHPPVAYPAGGGGTVLVHPDLGTRVPWTNDGEGLVSETCFAWCEVHDRRINVLEWLDQETAAARVFDLDADVFRNGHPHLVVPVALIPGQLGFEYPRSVAALSKGLTTHRYIQLQLLWDLATSSLMNRELRRRQKDLDKNAAGESWDPDSDDSSPLVTAMLVGTPSRRMNGSARLAHLAAWRLDSMSANIAELYGSVRSNDDSDLPNRVEELAQGWFDSATVGWMSVFENRPEVTQRRDHSAPTSWLRGQRVLVLGCGALGGPVSEYCVRSGVKNLTIADNSVVGPGVLVRQLFTNADIGMGKARALADRLSRIRPDLDVLPLVEDVRSSKHITEGRDQYDLVIDATADASVRAAIEHAWKGRGVRPSLVTMVIGHEASRGLVTTSFGTATGAGTDAFRKVALLRGSDTPGWEDIADDLFPRQSRTELFFPEPGCSAPTFVGSAAQTSALAGMMLDEATRALTSAGGSDGKSATSATLFASAVRLGSASTSSLGTTRKSWPSDLVIDDVGLNFEVRLSAFAYNEIYAEVRRGSRLRGPLIETGGMLLGTFDDATGVVHVDKAVGPPPDSYLSRHYFQHGTEGAQTRIEQELDSSGGNSGFLGYWHTHPCGPASPSQTDKQGMASIVGPDGKRQRALMMIVGGPSDRWNAWRDGKPGIAPDVFARVVPRSLEALSAEQPKTARPDLQKIPAGNYFRGGFSRPNITPINADGQPAQQFSHNRERKSWQWRRLRPSR